VVPILPKVLENASRSSREDVIGRIVCMSEGMLLEINNMEKTIKEEEEESFF
jgi:hypothetical protein